MQYRGKENPNGNSEKQPIIKNEQECHQLLSEINYLETVWIPFLEDNLQQAQNRLRRFKKAQAEGAFIRR